MDGLLLDTEDLYTQVTNTLLAQLGRPPLTWNIKAQLQGRPVSAVCFSLLHVSEAPVMFLVTRMSRETDWFTGHLARFAYSAPSLPDENFTYAYSFLP